MLFRHAAYPLVRLYTHEMLNAQYIKTFNFHTEMG